MTIQPWQERYQARAKAAIAANQGFTRDEAALVRTECKDAELADYKQETARLRAELSAVQASVQPPATTALQVLSFEPGTQSAESPIVEQLQRWAQQLGYLLVKQPKRRLAPAEVGVTEWQCCGTYSPCRGECACPVEPD